MQWHRAAKDKPNAPVLSGQIQAIPRVSIDGVVLLDQSGQIIDINARALELLHLAHAKPVGQDFWDVAPEEITERYQSSTRKLLAASGQHTFVAHLKFEDSWLEYAFRSHPGGCVVNIRDVADLQATQRLLASSEQYNQLIFGDNPNAMWIFDRDSLYILAANRAATVFYGFPRKQFLELQMGALFPDGEGTALLSVLSNGKKQQSAQFLPQICKQKKSNGQLVLVELACGLLALNGHDAVLVSISDVTDRHLSDRSLRRENTDLEQQLAKVSDELAATNRDLAAFTHALSNDLQAPLHATNGFAAMLSEKYSAVLDVPGRHYVNRIQVSTQQLARLVDDLHTLVKLPSARWQPEVFDLAPVCRAILDEIRKRDVEPDKPLMLEMQPGLLVFGDKSLLTVAMGCLLQNAWKFSARKAERWIKVELQTGAVSEELVVRVTDNGAGFDAVYAGKLFTAFQRLHSSADFPGHGLGLAIVKRVALRHGGRVWAETTERAGASFSLVLPHGNPGAAAGASP